MTLCPLVREAAELLPACRRRHCPSNCAVGRAVGQSTFSTVCTAASHAPPRAMSTPPPTRAPTAAARASCSSCQRSSPSRTHRKCMRHAVLPPTLAAHAAPASAEPPLSSCGSLSSCCGLCSIELMFEPTLRALCGRADRRDLSNIIGEAVERSYQQQQPALPPAPPTSRTTSRAGSPMPRARSPTPPVRDLSPPPSANGAPKERTPAAAKWVGAVRRVVSVLFWAHCSASLKRRSRCICMRVANPRPQPLARSDARRFATARDRPWPRPPHTGRGLV